MKLSIKPTLLLLIVSSIMGCGDSPAGEFAAFEVTHFDGTKDTINEVPYFMGFNKEERVIYSKYHGKKTTLIQDVKYFRRLAQDVHHTCKKNTD